MGLQGWCDRAEQLSEFLMNSLVKMLETFPYPPLDTYLRAHGSGEWNQCEGNTWEALDQIDELDTAVHGL